MKEFSNIFNGSKVKLRALEIADIEILYKWENDTSIWHLGNTLFPLSKYALKRFIEDSCYDIYTTKQLRLIIETHEDITVGIVDLFDFDPNHLRAGLGVIIGDKSNRKKGYAKEAIMIVENYCREFLHLHQLFCNISEDNEASYQLFSKLGYKQAGVKLQWLKTIHGWKSEFLFQKFL